MGWRNESMFNGSGHMTKMAAMPNILKPLKSSSSEPNDRDYWYLVYSIGHSSTKFVKMMTPG